MIGATEQGADDGRGDRGCSVVLHIAELVTPETVDAAVVRDGFGQHLLVGAA
ncbi:hypothetical protein P1S61_33390 [Streptomyces sp. ME08-AFT2]|jgi:hypothetical protein|uniref:hypothetical protein n=1 Tax=Streptomyces sp. ME08-AFT2 TaxID=3028683 RepID=UPI0029B7AF23|nr:hypothetical protein [Streptomyces sp. ME08-AFT2]MDX3313880.1 hypothetical protein [Streptomyces sp. ME08-AFT2]